MSQLLFVTLAGQGHVIPTLPLVVELARRGHRVRYACGPELAEAVTAAGARWVPLPGLEPFRPPAHVGPDVMVRWFRHYFAACVCQIRLAPARCSELAPPRATAVRRPGGSDSSMSAVEARSEEDLMLAETVPTLDLPDRVLAEAVESVWFSSPDAPVAASI